MINNVSITPWLNFFWPKTVVGNEQHDLERKHGKNWVLRLELSLSSNGMGEI